MYCDKILSESKNIVSLNFIYTVIIRFRPFAKFSCKIIEFNA